MCQPVGSRSSLGGLSGGAAPAAIAWADPAARAALLQELVADSATCQAWYTGTRAGTESLQQAVVLLATVTTQDTEPAPRGANGPFPRPKSHDSKDVVTPRRCRWRY